MERKEYLMKTSDEAFQAVNNMGMLEFQFSTEGAICFKQIDCIHDDKGFFSFEVTFRENKIGNTFFKFDSISNFLKDFEILDIVIISDDCNSSRYEVYSVN